MNQRIVEHSVITSHGQSYISVPRLPYHMHWYTIKTIVAESIGCISAKDAHFVQDTCLVIVTRWLFQRIFFYYGATKKDKSDQK